MPAAEFGDWMPDLADLSVPHLIDAKNVLSAGEHYRPLPDLTSTTSAMTGSVRGHIATKDINQSVHMFAADDVMKIYELVGTTWTDRSKGGGYSAALVNTRFRFAAYGDRLIGVNELDNPQFRDMSTGTLTFADLAGSPPKAKFVATYLEFVVLGVLSSSAMAIAWSGVGNSTQWTPGTNQSDQQEFADGGNITGLVATSAALYIFQEKCIRRMIYVGGALIMQIDKIVDGMGCIEPNSLVSIGQRMFFLDEDGWYAFDGESQPVAIGQDKFDQWFLDNSYRTSWPQMSTIIDPKNRVFVCAFVSSAAPSIPDTLLFYNYNTGRASYASVSTQMLAHAQALAVSIDDLTGNLDTDYNLSFDDPYWQGGAFYFAAYRNNALYSFSGSNLEATLTFGAVPLADGQRATVEWLKPVTDSADATIAGGAQVKPSDAITFQSQVSQQTSGRCPQRNVNGFYLSSKTVIPAGSTWSWARGIEWKARAAGMR